MISPTTLGITISGGSPGRTLSTGSKQNYFASDRIQKALNVVTDPNTGRPACASFVDQTDPNCVPYDIYHIGGVTPAALNYLSAIGIQTGYTQQNIVGLHVTSDLGSAYDWTLPWAKNGVGVAFGYEHRTDRLQNVPDVNLETNNLSGQGGATLFIQGQVTVDEVFAEVKVPIAERQDYAYLLQFDGSYRYSDYSNGPQTNSFGLGGEWAPIKGYTLRGSYQQAIRAANIIELFQQQGTNLFGGSDPCAGPNPSASLEGCLRTGLPANLYGSNLLTSPAGQYNFLQGGNPDLTPEKAESYTIGMVFDQPSNIRGFSATIDYWNIKVKNNIGIVGAQDQLNQCVDTGTFCNNIHRDNLGTLWLDGGGYISAPQPEPRHDGNLRYRLHGELHMADPGLGQPAVLVRREPTSTSSSTSRCRAVRRTIAPACTARSAAHRRRDGVRTSA